MMICDDHLASFFDHFVHVLYELCIICSLRDVFCIDADSSSQIASFCLTCGQTATPTATRPSWSMAWRKQPSTTRNQGLISCCPQPLATFMFMLDAVTSTLNRSKSELLSLQENSQLGRQQGQIRGAATSKILIHQTTNRSYLKVALAFEKSHTIPVIPGRSGFR